MVLHRVPSSGDSPRRRCKEPPSDFPTLRMRLFLFLTFLTVNGALILVYDPVLEYFVQYSVLHTSTVIYRTMNRRPVSMEPEI